MIKLNDSRYERAEYQEFGTFTEGTNFLREYCGNCRRNEGCSARKSLCAAMGENYPMWHPWFVKRDLKIDFYIAPRISHLGEEPADELPDTVISCSRFRLKKSD